MLRTIAWCVAGALVAPVAGRPAGAQDLPRGAVIERVQVADDPAESYALYLPSDYSAERAWSVLLAFHPAANGRAFVETYRQAAERYGYIVAGSNTSRNGSWDVITRAVRAMSRDVGRRFVIDAARMYLTGHSGGARVAMDVALGARDIAGVIASSAGFPDAKPRRRVAFPVFATAGRDDFNYLELMRLDQALASPHRLAVFEGGHTLPPPDVARDAIEWMELQAMRSGRRATDGTLVEALYAARLRQIEAAPDPLSRLRQLQAVVADFDGLRDVAAVRAEAAALANTSEVKGAMRQARGDLETEARLLDEALAQEARLRAPEARSAALARLRQLFEAWSRAARAADPSVERSRARRLLGAVAAGAASRVADEEYRALVQQYRWRLIDDD